MQIITVIAVLSSTFSMCVFVCGKKDVDGSWADMRVCILCVCNADVWQMQVCCVYISMTFCVFHLACVPSR